MAKVSKYEQMIGQVVSMSFSNVKVTGYRKLDKTSKSGRTYKKYEVEIDSVLWVSTTSFKNQSFSKRYFKALDSKSVSEPVMHYPAIINEKPISADIIARHVNTLANILCYKELKQEFHKLAGIYHPDKGGNAQVFSQLAEIYSISEEVLRTTSDRKEKLGIERYEGLVKMLINCKRKQQGYGF